MKCRVVHAERFGHPRLEVGQDHVAGACQPVRQLPSFGIRQVDADRPLVAVACGVRLGHRGQPADAQTVGVRGVLDLDHVGTQVPEQSPGVGTDHDHTQVEDADPLQRASLAASRPTGQQRRRGEALSHTVARRSDVHRARAVPVDLTDPRRNRCPHAGGQVGLDEEAARAEVLGIERFGQRQHRRGGDSVILAARFQLGAGLVGAEPLDGLEQLRRVESLAQLVERGIGELLGAAHQREHAAPLPFRQDADANVAVLARDDGVALPFGVPVAELAGDRHARRCASRGAERRVEGLHRAVEHREIDEITLPAA